MSTHEDAVSAEENKAEFLAAVRDAAALEGQAPPGVDLGALVGQFYRHAALEDLIDRSPEDLASAAVAQVHLARDRPQGTATIHVHTPSAEADGWSAGGRSVVQVVTDDMPFLVDSVSMALEQHGHGVHRLMHPRFVVRRDLSGELLEVFDDTTSTEAHDLLRESWIYLEVDRGQQTELAEIRAGLVKVLSDVRESVEDWDRMQHRAEQIIAELESDPPPLPDAELSQGIALLRWLADDHFTFLGYREYDLRREGEEEILDAVPGTGYGILRADPEHPRVLPPMAAYHARDKVLLVLAKANSRSTVHRRAHLDYVGVKKFNDRGEVIGERRFVGLLSSSAYIESVLQIPLLRDKTARVLEKVGFEPASHAGKAMINVLETYPRDELFQTPVEDLVPIVSQVLSSRERRQLRLFVRRDRYGRFLSCLVYLPRERYNTAVRERISSILLERLGGASVDFAAQVGESVTARLHFVVRPEPGEVMELPDVVDLERRVAAAARSWIDDFTEASVTAYGEDEGNAKAKAYAGCFPEAYKEDFRGETGVADLARLEAIEGDEGLALAFASGPDVDAPEGADAEELRLTVYRVGPRLSLSQILPTLSTMGVEVVDERPYDLEGLPGECHLYHFGLRYTGELPEHAQQLFEDTVMAVWGGLNEADGFNALVLAAGLPWRQASVLRAYAKYMRQGGTPFGQDYIEGALQTNTTIARSLAALFQARFDPDAGDGREERCAEIEDEIVQALEEVSSLDQDRILRSYLTAIKATLRTNFFQTDADGGPLDRLTLKLDPASMPELPEPRPEFEIFVYSPRVEGVHLRFGAVARGGLRWSDRRDDFRTEVLGLVKAQMVKNTVIVPVGAKGGFFAKQLPPASDREAWMAEGVRSYRTFISGMLDITDNIVDAQVVPPERVVRHDADDPYLVVAADKGTASFSDLANEISAEYGFWLGDAFASGGSVGYDHKAMGITARGAWVSVRRHFRERGIDSQNEDFTCVGIGDMSGDVFGNGMLCSTHTRLVAAFDHRDIFVDPFPDPKTSYAERKRLFELPRSSWQDYDTELISEGGGIFSRGAKSIPITAQMREALAIEDERLTPAELIRAILRAPVDLLWNGGIGTYVKAASESHADVGDKANDAIRIDGGQVRAHCVGEGGNLGLTQLGRIEYAAHGREGEGGRINTDFIDNSAGVDASDHEVNIKILLDHLVADGEMDKEARNELLASMTDEVAELVLADNYAQNLALASAVHNAPRLLHVHEDWMRSLESAGKLNRELEALPTRREVTGRIERKEGLTSPELAVLFAYTKIVLAEDLLEGDLPDDPYLRSELFAYFPSAMRQDYRRAMERHRLRREIIVTGVVNQLVNEAGISYVHRLSGETGASASELARAHAIAVEIFGARRVARRISECDNRLPAPTQTLMRLEIRTQVERACRWLLNNRALGADTEAVVDRFEVTVEKVMEQLPSLLTGEELSAFEERRDALIAEGVEESLAVRVAICPPAYAILDIVVIATEEDRDVFEVARRHFEVGERLGFPALGTMIHDLPRTDRWQSLARAALLEDLHDVHAQLTTRALSEGMVDEDEVESVLQTLDEIGAEEADLARLSVGLRTVRNLLNQPS